MTIDRGTEYPVEVLLGPLNEVERKFAPPRLFVAGDRGVLEQGARVCIVGTREPTREGVARARKLAKILVENGVIVVSGLAKGIDTAAHEAAMDFSGRTIAVIGTSIDKAYPKENGPVQSRIMEEQLCVSQFAPGHPTLPKNFPIRNRTMALIGDATVLIEAGERSGAISQAWEALRLGRALFLTKALVDCRYAWTAELMRYGAAVLANDTIDDLLSALPDRRFGVEADVVAL